MCFCSVPIWHTETGTHENPPFSRAGLPPALRPETLPDKASQKAGSSPPVCSLSISSSILPAFIYPMHRLHYILLQEFSDKSRRKKSRPVFTGSAFRFFISPSWTITWRNRPHGSRGLHSL